MSDKLTVAQALRRIKKLKGQIAEHDQRAKAGVSYDTAKLPSFRYTEEVSAMFSVQDEMIGLEARVTIANAASSVLDGDKSIPTALAIRILQELKGRIAFLKGLNLRNETIKDRQTDWDDIEAKHVTRVTEMTYASDLSEKDRDAQVKSLQDRFETLNNVVEDANHTVMV